MNILTIDIEDWFHLLDDKIVPKSSWESRELRINKNTDLILDALISRKQKATFFVLGWIAMKFPSIVRKIDDSGFEIGSHSQNHILPYKMTDDEFQTDLTQSLENIEQVIGKKVEIFRAPGFAINEAKLNILSNNGIKIDSSVSSIKLTHNSYFRSEINLPAVLRINGLEIREFPLNHYKILSKKIMIQGGGFFRITPKFLLKQMISGSNYNLLYFHPRDFDPEQPRISNISFKDKFRFYSGLKNSFSKFQWLLDNFKFSDIRSANESIDWSGVPSFELFNRNSELNKLMNMEENAKV